MKLGWHGVQLQSKESSDKIHSVPCVYAFALVQSSRSYNSDLRGLIVACMDSMPLRIAPFLPARQPEKAEPHHQRLEDPSIRSVTDIQRFDQMAKQEAASSRIASPKKPHYREASITTVATEDSTASGSTPTGRSLVPSSSSPDFSPGRQPLPRESSLSLRDMYDDGDTYQQEEYFFEEDSNLHNSIRTPPTTLSAPPPATPPTLHNREAFLPPAALLSPSSGTVVSSATASSMERTVLYSAIGSLENPSAQSLSRYHAKRGGGGHATNKFEFASTRISQPKLTKENGLFDSQQQPPLQVNQVVTTTTTSTETSTALPANEVGEPEKHKKPSNLRKGGKLSTTTTKQQAEQSDDKKKVTIAEGAGSGGSRKTKKKKGPTEMFRPSSDAYTPRMGKKVIKYKPAEMRTPVAQMASPLGTLQRPNFKDALRRVAMILHQHVVKIEQRFERQQANKSQITAASDSDVLFRESMRDTFSEERFATPKYKCTMVRVPMARPGMVYGLKRIREKYEIPSEEEIYDFGHRLFKTVQLSSECSIVCLIYVERLMANAKVPLLASTWKPIFMCGLLLASKVWQDLSSWNIEFASVYPQYSLEAINRLELQFLRMVKWDLYISSSEYAKYYFALRSLVEKSDFRQRYNRMVGGVDSVQAAEALKIEKRSSMVKEEAILQLSRSM